MLRGSLDGGRRVSGASASSLRNEYAPVGGGDGDRGGVEEVSREGEGGARKASGTDILAEMEAMQREVEALRERYRRGVRPGCEVLGIAGLVWEEGPVSGKRGGVEAFGLKDRTAVKPGMWCWCLEFCADGDVHHCVLMLSTDMISFRKSPLVGVRENFDTPLVQ